MKRSPDMAATFPSVQFIYDLGDDPPVPMFSFTMSKIISPAIAAQDHSIVHYESQMVAENAKFGMWDDWSRPGSLSKAMSFHRHKPAIPLVWVP